MFKRAGFWIDQNLDDSLPYEERVKLKEKYNDQLDLILKKKQLSKRQKSITNLKNLMSPKIDY